MQSVDLFFDCLSVTSLHIANDWDAPRTLATILRRRCSTWRQENRKGGREREGRERESQSEQAPPDIIRQAATDRCHGRTARWVVIPALGHQLSPIRRRPWRNGRTEPTENLPLELMHVAQIVCSNRRCESGRKAGREWAGGGGECAKWQKIKSNMDENRQATAKREEGLQLRLRTFIKW